jgi:ankyrin repeat protein
MALAVQQGNERLMRSSLKKGLTPGSPLNEAGDTAVLLAIRVGSLSSVVLLYEAAGKKRAAFWRANAAGCGPLHEAVRLSNTDVLRWLLTKEPRLDRLDAGDRSGRTAVHHAAALDRPEAIELLAAAGANVNARTYEPWLRTPLHACAYTGAAGATRVLLELGADPRAVDGSGDVPAHDAAAWGHTLVLQLLMGAGVELNAANKDGQTVASLARTQDARRVVRAPLLSAMHQEDAADVAAKLCSAGISPNSGDGLTGCTALHAAAGRNDLPTVLALLAAGALPDVRDHDGNTALHFAAGHGADAAVRALLAAGSDIRIRNKRGQMPFEVVPVPQLDEEEEEYEEEEDHGLRGR